MAAKNIKPMNIGISPVTSNNKYIELTIDCIQESGGKVLDSYSIGFRLNKLLTLDAIILNWFDKIPKDYLGKYYKPFLKIIIIFILKIFRIKIVYVLHNKLPQKEKTYYIYKKFINYLLKKSDRIIILSKSSKEYIQEDDRLNRKSIKEKLFFIPHPGYFDVYQKNYSRLRKDFTIPGNKLILLFVGDIRPYKNIEKILKVAKSMKDKKIHFIIAGNPNSIEYKKQISSLAKEVTNVTLILHFIRDDVLTALIEKSHALIFPYDINRCLNSGTAILAFSNSRTVIIPEIATVKDFNSDYYYGYNYSGEEEHETELIKKINRIYADYVNDPNSILIKGKLLWEELKEENSKQTIIERYEKLWEGLF